MAVFGPSANWRRDDQLSALVRENDLLVEKTALLTKELQAAQRAYEQLAKDNEFLRLKASEPDPHRDRDRDRSSFGSVSASALAVDNAQLVAQVQRLMAERQQLLHSTSMEASQILEEQLTQATAQLAMQAEMVAAAKNEAWSAQEQAAATERACHRIEAERAAAELQIAFLSKRLEESAERESGCLDKLQELQALSEQQEQSLQMVRAELGESETSRKQLQQQVTSLLRKNVAESSKELADSESEREQRTSALEKEMLQCNEALSQAQSSLVTAMQQRAAAESALERSRQNSARELAEEAQRREAAQTALAKKSDLLSQAEEKLAKAEARAASLEAELRTTQQNHTLVVKAQQEQLTRSTAENAALSTNVQELSRQLRQATEKLAAAEKALVVTKAKAADEANLQARSIELRERLADEKVSALLSQRQSLTASLHNMGQESEQSAENERAQTRSTIEQQSKIIQTLRIEIVELTQSKAALLVERQALIKQQEELQRQVADSGVAQQALLTRLAASQQQIDLLQNKVNMLAERESALLNQLSTARRQMDQSDTESRRLLMEQSARQFDKTRGLRSVVDSGSSVNSGMPIQSRFI
eukprot:m.140662 g.140662  ORF g.140662 m.140662 type:complete len:594 (+) comp16676_c2_seq1:105-1886(+)